MMPLLSIPNYSNMSPIGWIFITAWALPKCMQENMSMPLKHMISWKNKLAFLLRFLPKKKNYISNSIK